MNPDRIEIKGRMITGLLAGGLGIVLTGIALYWLYFEYQANIVTLIMGIFVMLAGLLFVFLSVSAYLSCLVVDGEGIVQTGLFRGFRQIRWDQIERAVEKAGLEPGIFKMEIISPGTRMEIYSNWVEDYDLLFSIVEKRVPVDTTRTRVHTPASIDSKALHTEGGNRGQTKNPSNRTNLRVRVTGGQILYLLAMLSVTVFLFWRAFHR